MLTFSNGKTSPGRASAGEYVVYGANGTIGLADEKNAPQNTIVIGRVGSYCGAVHFSKDECWVTDNAIKANVKNHTNPYYAYYLLSYLDLNRYRAGSGQPLINQSILNSIEVPNIDLNQQNKIAHILKKLDKKISLLIETNQTLESIAQAIFKSWFVDFDSVHAKQLGIECAGIDKATADLFPNSFVEGELGLMPKGWEPTKLGSIVQTVLGGTPSKNNEQYWLNGNIPWINSGEVNKFRVTKPTALITELGLKKSSTKLMPKRTTLLAITGATLGQISLTEFECCANQSVIGIIGNDILSNEYLYLWMQQNIKELLNRQTGGAQQHVNKNDVNDLNIILPSASVITYFNKLVTPLFDSMSNNCFCIEALNDLRDTLIPRLISGKLDLSNIEEQLEGAT